MIARDTGKVYPLSEDDAQYLSKLIGNKKTLPGGWKCICSYDFVLEDTTWSYCAEGGVFNNFAENIGLDALNETEQARLDKIIMTSAGYAFTEGNEIRVTVCRTGESYSLSAEDARYLSELIGNAKPLPNIEVGTPDYEFISGKTAWSYCADEGFLTNPSEWIMIKKLSETERARLNGIVAARINAK